jgi:hypothetical protein
VRERDGGQVLVLEAASTPATDGDPDDQDATDGDGLDGLRALCVAHWTRHPDQGSPVQVAAVGPRAVEALRGWGLSAQQ